MLLRHVGLSFALVLAATVLIALPAHASFQDTEGAWYHEAVEALVERDIVEGCTPDEFCPTRAINRGQVASILARALDLEPDGRIYFRDTTDSVHHDNINALAAAGIASGCSDDAFCPLDPITREQLASLLARAFDLPPADETYFDDVGPTHGDSVDRLAAAGITGGCGDPLTAFCPRDPLIRAHGAAFVARALDLVDRVEVTSLEQRRQEQAEIDAERERQEREQREAEAQAARDAERERMWDDLAKCESGGNWSLNTGNGYYGGLQFSLDSWRWVGGSGYPHHHSREEQIYRAEILLERQGWSAWPHCSQKLGYR